MGKVTHHGLRKIDPNAPQVWTISFGGLLGKDYAPKPRPQAEGSQEASPESSPQQEAPPMPYVLGTYKEHPEDEDFYPPNPKTHPRGAPPRKP